MKILLICYDNDSYLTWFPQGLAHVAAALLQAGHQVEIYNQDLHHYPDQHLTRHLDRNRFDAVGVGVIAGYYQYRKLLALSRAVNGSKNRPFFMIGGHGPSPEPEYFLEQTGADATIIGEGDLTVVELMEAVAGHLPFSRVRGIAYREGDQVVVNPRRELARDIDSLPWPAYRLFPMEVYRLLRMPNCRPTDFVLPLLSGRGCPFKCTFCYRMDEGFRARSNQAIIEEIRFLKKEYGVTYIAFSDELLMSSVERTAGLCEDLIKADLGIIWDCNGRLNYARPELLGLMKRAGCVFINYGIESMDDQVLRNMKKGLTTDQVIRGVEATLKAGISPGLNIIFGNLGDNRETLQKGVEFLLKYDDGAQLRTIRPVTPYPGSELYAQALEMGLLKDCRDFYENKHLNSDLLAVNFTELSDEEFYQVLEESNERLICHYFGRKKESLLDQNRRLYRQRDVSFRGFRQT